MHLTTQLPNFGGLQTDLRQLMLGFLQPKDVCSFRSVHPAFANDLAMWLKITLDKNFALMTRITVPAFVRKIRVLGDESTCTGALAFAALIYKPECINLRESQVSASALRFLVDMPSLRVLNLFRCRSITSAALHNLGKLTMLQQLDLGGTRIDKADLAQLAQLVHLEKLGLSCNAQLRDAGLATISNMVNLSCLNLHGCKTFTNAGLEHLSALPLRTLSLWLNEQLTDAGLAHISAISTLTSLDLGSCHGMTNAGLVHVAKLQKLQSLSLAECKWVSCEGLEHLEKLPELRDLGLKNCSNVTDDAIVSVAKLPLTKASLSSCDISDVGLHHLSRARTLEIVYLNRCDRISEVGLLYLDEMPSMKQIHLADCTQFAKSWLIKLRVDIWM